MSKKQKMYNVSKPLSNFTPKGDFVLEQLVLSGNECCGWVLVSGFYTSYDSKSGGFNYEGAKKDLKNLSTGLIEFVLSDQWDDEEEPMTDQFPLQAVLTASQIKVFGPLMDEFGWQRWPSFRNPNTDNICTPFIFIPSNCKVS